MKALLELRQRSKGYEPVQTEDDFELVPSQLSLKQDRINNNYNNNNNSYVDNEINDNEEYENEYIYSKPKKKESKSCAWFVLILSISGVIFLTIIGILLKSESIYIKLSKVNDQNKSSLGDSVVGAAMMYLITAIISAYYIFRSSKRHSTHFNSKD